MNSKPIIEWQQIKPSEKINIARQKETISIAGGLH